MSEYHIPVLLRETIEYLNITSGEKYIDCTLGGGGHTAGILKAGGLVLAIDHDLEAIKYNQEKFSQEISQGQLKLKKGNFAHLKQLAEGENFIAVAGILYDLGVSSHQLETDYRGFSFNKYALLDMRMAPDCQQVTAADLVNAGSEKELARLILRFGEEHFAKQIAREIVRDRQKGPITTTGQLARLITGVRKRSPSDRTHPATRTFQALRLAVNDELSVLADSLPQAVDLLKSGGKIVVISFHSLEDGIIKDFFKNNHDLQVITTKPIEPGIQEIEFNPRARSGRLRAAKKLAPVT